MTSSSLTEYGSIEKQVRIDASPAVVFEVVSRPEHIAQWWSDEASFVPAPGEHGTLAWGTHGDDPMRVEIAVVESVPGERFCFRWNAGEDGPVGPGSVLVTFRLVPDGAGTLLTVTEEGMREHGWEAAVLESYYVSHERGWAMHLDRLAVYAVELDGRT